MKALVIEDDRNVALNLVRGLAENGFSTNVAYDGETGLQMARQGGYQILIVDRMLPGLDGLSVIRALREDKDETPALILTALSEVDDTVDGLEAGADDYMAKPFAFAELLARINTLLRRHEAATRHDPIIQLGDVVIDKVARSVTREGKLINLQPREFELLIYLAGYVGEKVTRQMLLENVWDFGFDPQTNIVDVHISRLRNKLDKDFRDAMIKTVRGVGYMLEIPNQ